MKNTSASLFFILIIIIGGAIAGLTHTDFWRGFGFGLVFIGALAAGWTILSARRVDK